MIDVCDFCGITRETFDATNAPCSQLIYPHKFKRRMMTKDQLAEWAHAHKIQVFDLEDLNSLIEDARQDERDRIVKLAGTWHAELVKKGRLDEAELLLRFQDTVARGA